MKIARAFLFLMLCNVSLYCAEANVDESGQQESSTNNLDSWIIAIKRWRIRSGKKDLELFESTQHRLFKKNNAMTLSSWTNWITQYLTLYRDLITLHYTEICKKQRVANEKEISEFVSEKIREFEERKEPVFSHAQVLIIERDLQDMYLEESKKTLLEKLLEEAKSHNAKVVESIKAKSRAGMRAADTAIRSNDGLVKSTVEVISYEDFLQKYEAEITQDISSMTQKEKSEFLENCKPDGFRKGIIKGFEDEKAERAREQSQRSGNTMEAPRLALMEPSEPIASASGADGHPENPVDGSSEERSDVLVAPAPAVASSANLEEALNAEQLPLASAKKPIDDKPKKEPMFSRNVKITTGVLSLAAAFYFYSKGYLDNALEKITDIWTRTVTPYVSEVINFWPRTVTPFFSQHFSSYN